MANWGGDCPTVCELKGSDPASAEGVCLFLGKIDKYLSLHKTDLLRGPNTKRVSLRVSHNVRRVWVSRPLFSQGNCF